MITTTFPSITKASIKFENQQLKRVLSIQYQLKFEKGHTKVYVLIDFDNKVNTMTPDYPVVLNLYIYFTNIRN